MKIILATRNPGKFEEMEKELHIKGIELLSVSNFNVEDVEETGKSFTENAVLKSKFVAEVLNIPTIADDSGLEILALNNYPGIYSARCAGENATDEEKRQHILKKVGGIEDRRAKFVSVVSFTNIETDITSWFIGTLDGEILEEPRGEARNSVQYDSIFYIPEMKKTLAEMTKEEKNKISHRGKACRQLKQYLKVLYGKK